jgi:TRAP-type mannitol/chloroaromatic compound transport system substrate-binding protein
MAKRRRELLLGAAGAIAAVAAFPAPAISRGTRQLKMVTDWTRDQPGFGTSAARLARSITTISEGRLTVIVYPINTLVKAFETFDAVSAGAAEMYHSTDNYFGSRSPALDFFSAVPYGMTADELSSWINFGGGQALWDELGAGFNLKPILCTNTGAQMGG